MEFFKVRKLIGARKLNSVSDRDRTPSDSPKCENVDAPPKAEAAEPEVAAAEEEEEDDDDDDFIEKEVKRRLKELRKNNFMVLIPEETCLEEEEEEEEDETSTKEWRDWEVGDGYPWCGFDTLYDKYCERMLLFDKMSVQPLHQGGGPLNVSNQLPRSASKKLSSTLKCLYFKKCNELQDDSELMQQSPEDDPYQILETAYVAQVALSWEALHCQYMQLHQKITSQPENPTSYIYAAQAFQQFQVLLQRFIENEPFEQGSRAEIYARARSLLPKLLQVPNFQGMVHKENKEDDLDTPILASDFRKIMEDSISTFHLFLKMDTQKYGSSQSLFRGHGHAGGSLQQIQTSLDKKEIKVKELWKKKKGRKKSWPTVPEEVELLFGLIDIKVVCRVLSMTRLSNEQLLWCEEKMSKIEISGNKLHRDGAPILFPC